MPDKDIGLKFKERTVGMPGAFAGDIDGGGIEPTDYINDEFTAANGTTLSGRTPLPANIGTTWNITGTVTIQGNAVQCAAVQQGAYIDFQSSNIDYQVTYNAGGELNHFWITFCKDSGATVLVTDGYRIYVSAGGAVVLQRMDSGSETTLASTSVSFNTSTTHTYRIRYDDTTNEILIDYDGSTIIDYTDSSPPTLGTRYGFYASSGTDVSLARYDNVLITDLEGGIPPSSPPSSPPTNYGIYGEGVKSLVLTESVEVLEQDIIQLDTSDFGSPVGDFRIPIGQTKNFAKIISVILNCDNEGSGFTYEVVDYDITNGPRIRTYINGTLTDVVISGFIRGFEAVQ